MRGVLIGSGQRYYLFPLDRSSASDTASRSTSGQPEVRRLEGSGSSPPDEVTCEASSHYLYVSVAPGTTLPGFTTMMLYVPADMLGAVKVS